MDKMSLFSILTVSVPEVILDIYLAFVITGQRNRLYLDDRLNLIRLLVAVPLFTLTQVVTRATFDNIGLVLLANVICYTLILKIVYRTSWKDSITCVLVLYIFLISVEALYLGQFIMIFFHNIQEYYGNDIARLLSSLPERILQITVIISFWKWDTLYFNIRSDRKVFRTFLLLAILLLAAEASFVYVFINYMMNFTILYKVICIISSMSFGLINFLICRLVIILSKKTY